MSKLETFPITIKNKYLKTYKQNNPLIYREALKDPGKIKTQGSLMDLYSENGQYIGKGYYGKQNKGFGWVISKNKQCMLDKSFFQP